jgi:hypothetical protein
MTKPFCSFVIREDSHIQSLPSISVAAFFSLQVYADERLIKFLKAS